MHNLPSSVKAEGWFDRSSVSAYTISTQKLKRRVDNNLDVLARKFRAGKWHLKLWGQVNVVTSVSGGLKTSIKL